MTWQAKKIFSIFESLNCSLALCVDRNHFLLRQNYTDKLILFASQIVFLSEDDGDEGQIENMIGYWSKSIFLNQEVVNRQYFYKIAMNSSMK